jgi:hypothetical protein
MRVACTGECCVYVHTVLRPPVFSPPQRVHSLLGPMYSYRTFFLLPSPRLMSGGQQANKPTAKGDNRAKKSPRLGHGANLTLRQELKLTGRVRETMSDRYIVANGHHHPLHEEN